MKYHSEAIMSAMASQIICVSIVCSTGWSGADQRKHQSSLSLTGLCEGNSPPHTPTPHSTPTTPHTPTHPRPPKKWSENVSIWWCHHVNLKFVCKCITWFHNTSLYKLPGHVLLPPLLTANLVASNDTLDPGNGLLDNRRTGELATQYPRKVLNTLGLRPHDGCRCPGAK